MEFIACHDKDGNDVHVNVSHIVYMVDKGDKTEVFLTGGKVINYSLPIGDIISFLSEKEGRNEVN